MTDIKLKNCKCDYSFLTLGATYQVKYIDRDGNYVVDDADGYEYFINPNEIGEGKAWEKLTGFDFYELRNGDIAVMRNGRRYVFMRSIAGKEDSFVRLGEVGKETAANYNGALLHTNNHDGDVMEVYRCDFVAAWNNWDTLKGYTCVFKREDRKRMTVEEIEELLGYKVAIVDKEGK